MIELAAIPRESVDVMWPIVSPGIEKMLKHGIGTHTAESVRQGAIDGDLLLFVAVREGELEPLATLICSVTVGDRRVFEVGMAWGTQMGEWLDEVFDGLLSVAIELKCDVVAITGRRGWVKLFKDRGFNEKMVVLTRELNNG